MLLPANIGKKTRIMVVFFLFLIEMRIFAPKTHDIEGKCVILPEIGVLSALTILTKHILTPKQRYST